MSDCVEKENFPHDGGKDNKGIISFHFFLNIYMTLLQLKVE